MKKLKSPLAFLLLSSERWVKSLARYKNDQYIKFSVITSVVKYLQYFTGYIICFKYLFASYTYAYTHTWYLKCHSLHGFNFL